MEQDARLDLVVMSGSASRVLSPGLNDPGSAIDVIGRLERLLAGTFATEEAAAPRYPTLWVRAVTPAHLMTDAFSAIARDGAAHVEVGIRLHKALRTLRHTSDPLLAEAARTMTARALAHAEDRLFLPDDKARLRALASS